MRIASLFILIVLLAVPAQAENPMPLSGRGFSTPDSPSPSTWRN